VLVLRHHLPTLLRRPCALRLHSSAFFLLRRRPPGSTLFPYTTLFRSSVVVSGTSSTYPVFTITFAEATSFAKVTNGVDYVQVNRSEEHTSELQSRENLVCRLLLEKKNVDLIDQSDYDGPIHFDFQPPR